MEHRPLSKVGKLGGKNSLDVLWLSGDEEAELAREANLDCVRRLGGSDAEKSVESLEELVPELITSNPQENRNGCKGVGSNDWSSYTTRFAEEIFHPNLEEHQE